MKGLLLLLASWVVVQAQEVRFVLAPEVFMADAAPDARFHVNLAPLLKEKFQKAFPGALRELDPTKPIDPD